MIKILSTLALVALSGCSATLYKGDIAYAELLCSEDGGLLAIKVAPLSVTVHCMNGVSYE